MSDRKLSLIELVLSLLELKHNLVHETFSTCRLGKAGRMSSSLGCGVSKKQNFNVFKGWKEMDKLKDNGMLTTLWS